MRKLFVLTLALLVTASFAVVKDPRKLKPVPDQTEATREQQQRFDGMRGPVPEKGPAAPKKEEIPIPDSDDNASAAIASVAGQADAVASGHSPSDAQPATEKFKTPLGALGIGSATFFFVWLWGRRQSGN